MKVIRRKRQMINLTDTVWKLQSGDNRVARGPIEVGVALAFSRCSYRVRDELSKLGLSASRKCVHGILEKMISTRKAVLEPWVQQRIRGGVGMYLADNYAIIGKRSKPKIGEGVVKVIQTITMAVCTLAMQEGKSTFDIDSNFNINAGFDPKRVVDGLKINEPFKVPGEDGRSDENPLPSIRDLHQLEQQFGCFGHFPTFIATVLPALIFMKPDIWFAPMDQQGQWHHARLQRMLRDCSDEQLTALSITEEIKEQAKVTIHTIATFHIQKALIEGLIYNSTDAFWVFMRLLGDWGEKKYRGKGFNTEEEKLWKKRVPDLKQEATDLGVPNVKSISVKAAFIEAILKKKKGDLDDKAAIAVAAAAAASSQPGDEEDDDEQAASQQLSAAEVEEKIVVLDELLDAAARGEVDVEKASRLLRETDGVAHDILEARRELLNDAIQSFNSEQDVNMDRKDVNKKDMYISYTRAKHIIELLYRWSDKEGKELFKKSYGDDPAKHESPGIRYLWDVLSVRLPICFTPFMELQQGKPKKFLNSLNDMSIYLMMYRKPYIARTVALFTNDMLYLQEKQKSIYNGFCENCKLLTADVLVELLNARTSASLQASPLSQDEDAIKFWAEAATLKTAFFTNKSTESEMARRAEETKAAKYEDSKKGLGKSFMDLAAMLNEDYNDISALAFEGRKEEAREAYEEELDRCDAALNKKYNEKPSGPRGMYVREMQAEIVALCTEMGSVPDEKMLRTNPRPQKEAYIEQLTGWEITWQRIYGGGNAIRMLDEGQLCMSLVGSSPIAGYQLRTNQNKIQLIGMLAVIGDAERLVVKEDIKSPMDLEG
ncbi:hypothetical protein TrRE_jg12217, partial [Triparma retinervis]